MNAKEMLRPSVVTSVGTNSPVFEQLFNLLKQWGHCDLILDRELSDPLLAELTEHASAHPVLPINPQKAALPLDECLMLARLRVQHLSLLDRSIEISLAQNSDPTRPARAIGGWLFSRVVAPKDVVKRLEKAMVVSLPDAAPVSLLRLWDPRVIGHLTRILTPAQVANAIGPMACWAWIDRAGRLRLLESAAHATPTYVSPSLMLNVEQDAAIDRIEHINTLLKTLAGLGHAVDPDCDAELDALLLVARSKGHVTPVDMLAYCLHALLISENFDAIPEVQRVVAEAKIHGLGLCAALEKFDDSFWARHTDHV